MSLQVKLLFGVLFALNAVFFLSWYRARRTYIGRKQPLLSEYRYRALSTSG
jgi:hypothetical protein